LTLLQLMCEFGDNFYYTNQEKRNVFSYAALLDNDKVYELLLGNLAFNDDKFYLYSRDIYGKTAKDYIDMKGWELE
jgi:ankyrin repeat protein